jgi:hypothetical protein
MRSHLKTLSASQNLLRVTIVLP